MRRSLSIRRPRTLGQALLESVLVLLTLLLVVVGILDLGQVFFFHQVMSERARAGARWAAVNEFTPASPGDIRNVVVFDSPNPAGRTGLFGLRPEMVTVMPLPAAADVRFIEVRIDYPMQLHTPFLSRSFSSRFRVVRPVEGVVTRK